MGNHLLKIMRCTFAQRSRKQFSGTATCRIVFHFAAGIVSAWFLTTILIGCHSSTGPKNSISLNPNLRSIALSNTKKYTSFYLGIWRTNVLYAIRPLCRFMIGPDYEVQSDSDLEVAGQEKNWSYIDGNVDGSRLLLVESVSVDFSYGALYEYDTKVLFPAL